METNDIHTIEIAGLKLHSGAYCSFTDWMMEKGFQKERNAPLVISHINIHNLFILEKMDRNFLELLLTNSLLVFDGIGLKVAAYICGCGWRPDMNGTDLFPHVMQYVAEHRLKVFLLGGDHDTVSCAADNIVKMFPNAIIAGYCHGFFSVADEPRIIHTINSCEPDLLIIGMGFIKQEEFALGHRDDLRAKVIWNVGGLFDFLSQKKPRTPLWMRNLRLEWLFRMLLEPRRMWKRSFISAPVLLGYFFLFRIKGIIGLKR